MQNLFFGCYNTLFLNILSFLFFLLFRFSENHKSLSLYFLSYGHEAPGTSWSTLAADNILNQRLLLPRGPGSPPHHFLGPVQRGQRDFLISGSFLHFLVEVVRKSPRLNIVRKPRQVDRSSCTEMCCWPVVVTPRSGDSVE